MLQKPYNSILNITIKTFLKFNLVTTKRLFSLESSCIHIIYDLKKKLNCSHHYKSDNENNSYNNNLKIILNIDTNNIIND